MEFKPGTKIRINENYGGADAHWSDVKFWGQTGVIVHYDPRADREDGTITAHLDCGEKWFMLNEEEVDII